MTEAVERVVHGQDPEDRLQALRQIQGIVRRNPFVHPILLTSGALTTILRDEFSNPPLQKVALQSVVSLLAAHAEHAVRVDRDARPESTDASILLRDHVFLAALFDLIQPPPVGSHHPEILVLALQVARDLSTTTTSSSSSCPELQQFFLAHLSTLTRLLHIAVGGGGGGGGHHDHEAYHHQRPGTITPQMQELACGLLCTLLPGCPDLQSFCANEGGLSLVLEDLVGIPGGLLGQPARSRPLLVLLAAMVEGIPSSQLTLLTLTTTPSIDAPGGEGGGDGRGGVGGPCSLLVLIDHALQVALPWSSLTPPEQQRTRVLDGKVSPVQAEVLMASLNLLLRLIAPLVDTPSSTDTTQTQEEHLHLLRQRQEHVLAGPDPKYPLLCSVLEAGLLPGGIRHTGVRTVALCVVAFIVHGPNDLALNIIKEMKVMSAKGTGDLEVEEGSSSSSSGGGSSAQPSSPTMTASALGSIATSILNGETYAERRAAEHILEIYLEGWTNKSYNRASSSSNSSSSSSQSLCSVT